MIQIKNFEQFPYVREEKTQSFQKRAIYKYSPASQLFYLVTPNYGKNEKVMSVEEISALIRNHRMVQYKKSANIYQAINRAWENWSEDYEWNGTMYSVNASNSLEKAPWHDIGHSVLKIGYYHGRIVWAYVKPDGHVCYCKFEAINKHPDWSIIGWTHERNIHPIYNNSTHQYI